MNVEPAAPQRLRVLSVEDEPVFADVLRRLLDREGFAVTIERVASKPDLERALDDGAWDIVLSDHSVPGLSSTDALREVQTRGLDLPLIVVSGHIGEEAAVDAVRAGAHDYVSKASLNRLGVAVRRTLKDAAERATLRQRERDLEALHDVAFAAGRALDPARLASFAVERARELLHADGAWLYWWDGAAGVLRRIASTHRRDEDVALELRPGQSVSGAAFERGQLVAVERDASSPDRVPEIDAGVVSAIAAPLFVGE